VLAAIPDKLDLVSEVDGVSTSQIVSLLAVVLWGQNAHRACRDIVCVTNSKSPAVASVIKNVPDDGPDTGGACGTVESFHTNVRSGWRLHEIRESVGDAGSSTTIN
jgi:hypothetical protein